MPTRYDKEFKQNIINLYKQGESAAQLAREYGIGYSTVHKWIQGQAKTHIKRSASASRLVNYAEKRAVLKDGLNLDVDYAKSQFKRVREVYGNQGKTQAYASRISFSPKELDPSNKKDQQKVLEIAPTYSLS